MEMEHTAPSLTNQGRGLETSAPLISQSNLTKILELFWGDLIKNLLNPQSPNQESSYIFVLMPLLSFKSALTHSSTARHLPPPNPGMINNSFVAKWEPEKSTDLKKRNLLFRFRFPGRDFSVAGLESELKRDLSSDFEIIFFLFFWSFADQQSDEEIFSNGSEFSNDFFPLCYCHLKIITSN